MGERVDLEGRNPNKIKVMCAVLSGSNKTSARPLNIRELWIFPLEHILGWGHIKKKKTKSLIFEVKYVNTMEYLELILM